MKKKIVTLCLILALAATAVIGGTLAYFTDTDQEDNVFTTGKVEIELIEQQRNDDGDGLEAFKDNKPLYPIVGSAQGEKDQFGLPTAENYVDKIITVKNLAEDAYVRVFVAVPSELINTNDTGLNVLHFNIGNKFVAEGKTAGSENDPIAKYAEYWGKEELVASDFKINGVNYNIYSYTYLKALDKDEVTAYACIVGFYLDKNVDYDNDLDKYTITRNGVTTTIETDLSKITIPVFAQGVQAAGFTDNNGDGTAADEAFAASGLPANPWAE